MLELVVGYPGGGVAREREREEMSLRRLIGKQHTLLS